jgi:hypothetical protein
MSVKTPSGKTCLNEKLNDIVPTSALLISCAENDSALRKIVGGQLDFHGIAWYKADIMLAHFTANVGDDT